MTESRRALKTSIRRAPTLDGAELRRLQRQRFDALVAHAREHSPFLNGLYRNLGATPDPRSVPPTHKSELMSNFDDWVTDRALTLDLVAAFVDDPSRIGEQLLGKYTVGTTSGSTGTRGIFVLDERNVSVNQGLSSARMMKAFLDRRDLLKILRRGARMSLVIATGGHFLSTAIGARLQRHWLGRRLVQVVPVHAPVEKIVEDLNRFRPSMVLGYAGVLAILASEQSVGRLSIKPVLVQPAGEGLPITEYDRIADAFGATVRDAYSATECGFIAYSCAERWQHVNEDWVMLEPIDAAGAPVPPGEQSHSVLLTNLANTVQPIIRYDIGDSVRQRPDPCPCGSRFPAYRITGRTADLLTFTGKGGTVTVAPLTFGTLIDRTPGIDLFQLVQTAPDELKLRLRLAPGADGQATWVAATSQVGRLLKDLGLGSVRVTRDDTPPEQLAGGKFRTVMALSRS